MTMLEGLGDGAVQVPAVGSHEFLAVIFGAGISFVAKNTILKMSSSATVRHH